LQRVASLWLHGMIVDRAQAERFSAAARLALITAAA
jgi:hypothetical protein